MTKTVETSVAAASEPKRLVPKNKKVPKKKYVCVYVCVSERERYIEGERKRERERERERECVYFLCVAAAPEPLLAMNPVVVTVFDIQSR